MHYKIYKEIVIIFRYLKKFAKKKSCLCLKSGVWTLLFVSKWTEIVEIKNLTLQLL